MKAKCVACDTVFELSEGHICSFYVQSCPAKESTATVVNDSSIDQILSDRGKEYGPFVTHAEITQELKNISRRNPGWGKLSHDQREAIEMIYHKIGRILNGNPNNQDSWADIAGYSKLVADRLLGIIK